MDRWRKIALADRRRIAGVATVFVVAFAVFVLALVNRHWAVGIAGLAGCLLVFRALERSVRETAAGTTDTPVKSASSGAGLVTISRLSGQRRDRLRAYRVVVDGQEVGAVLPGDRASLPVPPGDPSVELRIDWARSEKVDLHVENGQEVRLRCRPGRPGAWVGGLVGRRGYIDLYPA